jgi:hypothetical protein
MLMQHATRPALADSVRTASRQVWLAGLGAAVVTRDWAGKEAGNVFRTLVREGTVVESRAIRFVGDRLDSSVSLLREARNTVEGAVKGYAGTAVTLVRRSLPRIPVTAALRSASPARKRAAKAPSASAAKHRKPAKPVAKRAARRTAKR